MTVLAGGGGAGGTTAGAVAVLGARIVSGAGMVCDLVGVDEALRGADLAIWVRLDLAGVAAGFATVAALTDVEPELARCLAEPGAVLADLAARTVISR